MVEAAKTSSDTASMIDHAVPCFKMRMQEGINTFDSMVAEGGGRVKTAAKVYFCTYLVFLKVGKTLIMRNAI
jgi:hypothetical protein